MREAWTDERLDDLSNRVDNGFHEVREEIRGFRAEIRAEFAATRAEVNKRFEAGNQSMNARFDALQGTLLQVGGGLIGVLILGFLGLIANS